MKVLSVYLQSAPGNQVYVGKLAEQNHQIYFQYDPDFLKNPVWLSPYKLPPQAELVEFKDKDYGPVFGLFNDSLPDGWGMLLMNRYLRRQGIDVDSFSVLDRLSFLGNSTMGSLVYEPAIEHEEYDRAVDLKHLADQSQRIIQGESTEVLPELLRMGGSPQGARPKVLIALRDGQVIAGVDDLPDGFEHWLVKFPGKGDFADAGRIEQAYAYMAGDAGILIPDTRLLQVESGETFFGIKRFDRDGNHRFHMHTLGGLIHSNFRVPECDYQTFIRVVSNLTKNQEDVERGFRQMVFNIMANNRDDHVKNFAFMIDGNGEWTLSPAYDLMYSPGPGGEHTMSVAGEGRSPGLDQVKQIGSDAGLKPAQVNDVVDQVRTAVRQWEECASQTGVSEESLAIIQDKITQNLDRFGPGPSSVSMPRLR